ncbi:MAG: ferrous iron transport protein B [Rubripirellula sp.]
MASAPNVGAAEISGHPRVALVGNPNTGKSTLFNALAGMNVRTGNYPGVTIEKKTGLCELETGKITVVDLPGTYSLAPRSPDELVAVEVLTDNVTQPGGVNLIVCVVNALLLQRNLFLVSQLLELGKPVVVALNMIDVAESRGMQIDVKRLSEQLGVPVVATSAAKRTGIDELKQAIAQQLGTTPEQHKRTRILPPEFYKSVARFRDSLIATNSEKNAHLPDDYLLERMILDRGGEPETQVIAKFGPSAAEALNKTRAELTKALGDPIDIECNARYAWAKTKLESVFKNDSRPSSPVTDRLDAILTHRVLGLVCFVFTMFLIFQSIYTFAALPMDLIDAATSGLSDAVCSVMEPGQLRSLITDGIIAGVGGVLIFLPQIALLFLFLALLEDCGYMARAAFLVDRIMTTFGLSGKSFLPMMSSFACAVPGVMAARVIENRRDRFATIMVAPLMSCSARLPVYLLLIAAFIPSTTYLAGWLSLPAIVLMSMYLVGVVAAIPVAWILKKTLLRGEVAPFVLELPEYKVPSPKVVLSRVWSASKAFVIRAGTLIFAASILIWFAGFWPGDHTNQYRMEAELDAMQEPSLARQALIADLNAESSRLLENSMLGRTGHLIEPIVRPLGWDWKIGVGVLASFPAREVIIATLGTIYSLGGDAEEEGLVGALQASTYDDGTPVYSVPVALSVMVFFALCAQCVSTLLVIRRETNSLFWPFLSFSYMTLLAYFGAWLTYAVSSQLL